MTGRPSFYKDCKAAGRICAEYGTADAGIRFAGRCFRHGPAGGNLPEQAHMTKDMYWKYKGRL